MRFGKKKSEEKWVQIGSYLLGIERSKEWVRFVAKSVSGDWRIQWGEGSIMFTLMHTLMADEKCHKYLEALLTMQYVATNYPHDMVAVAEKQELPVINGFAKLIDEQTAFEVSVKEKPTQEDDDEALKEVVEMQEIADELENLDKEA